MGKSKKKNYGNFSWAVKGLLDSFYFLLTVISSANPFYTNFCQLPLSLLKTAQGHPMVIILSLALPLWTADKSLLHLLIFEMSFFFFWSFCWLTAGGTEKWGDL